MKTKAARKNSSRERNKQEAAARGRGWWSQKSQVYRGSRAWQRPPWLLSHHTHHRPSLGISQTSSINKQHEQRYLSWKVPYTTLTTTRTKIRQRSSGACAKNQNQGGGERRTLLIRVYKGEEQRKINSISCTALISACTLLCTALIRRMFAQLWSEYLILTSSTSAPRWLEHSLIAEVNWGRLHKQNLSEPPGSAVTYISHGIQERSQSRGTQPLRGTRQVPLHISAATFRQ